MNLLLLVSGNLADNRHDPVRKGVRPKADFDALAEAIEALLAGTPIFWALTQLNKRAAGLYALSGDT